MAERVGHLILWRSQEYRGILTGLTNEKQNLMENTMLLPMVILVNYGVYIDIVILYVVMHAYTLATYIYMHIRM